MKKDTLNFQIENNKPLAKKGFTLVEFLLYFTISTMTILLISFFLFEVLRFRLKSQTIAEVEQEGVQVMQIITQTARNSEAITSPTLGDSTPTLTLDVVDILEDPTLFDISSGVIQIKEGAGLAIPLTSSNRVTASNLSFYNLSRASTDGTIRIQFTLAHLNPENKFEYDYTKTFFGSATLR